MNLSSETTEQSGVFLLCPYFDREGNRMTREEWRDKIERDRDYIRVALTAIHPANGVIKATALTASAPKSWPEEWTRVSTVLLGLNHSFGNGPPLIFETMVLEGNDHWTDDQWRYPSLEEAERGHLEMVERVRERYRKRAQRKRWKRGA